MEFYDWQKEIINHEGDITIRGGRQTGKSWATAERIVQLALKHKGCKILVIAPSGRQESYLRDKCIEIIPKNQQWRRRQIKEWLPLKNGTDIFVYPVGKTGVFVEGLSSVDFLFAEEAGHIREEVFDAIMPMLTEPRKRGLGWITLLGNTRKCRLKGYFYNSFQSKKFKKVHIRTENVKHADKTFLEEEKERMGEKKFNVIYGGDFDEEAFRYFSSDLLKRSATFKFWKLKKNYNKKCKYFLGVDPARFGKNDAGFVISELSPDRKRMKVVYAKKIPKTSLIDLRDECLSFNNMFKLKKIYIDDGGVGGGLIDILEDNPILKRLIIPLNNAARGKDFKVLKEDLYSNALKLLESKEVTMIKDYDLIDDLKEVEVDEDDRIKGNDLSEAFVRSLWSWKDKKPKLMVY